MDTETMREPSMAKRKVGRPPKELGVGRPVRLDRDLVQMGRAVCDYRGADVGDYMSKLLRDTIIRDYGKMLAEIAKKSGGK